MNAVNWKCHTVAGRGAASLVQPFTALKGQYRMSERTCTACGETKHDQDFYWQNGRPKSACKECTKEAVRARRDEKRAAQGLPPLDRSWKPSWDTEGRHCTACREWKPWSEFYETPAVKRAVNGRMAQCIPCHKAIQTKRTAEQGSKPYSEKWHATERECTKCGEVKPLDEFRPRKTGKYGRQSVCRVCQGIKKREYRALHGDYVRAKEREGYNRWKALRQNYGLTQEQYEAMVEAQGGRCGVCEREPSKRLVVDHCHKNGHVRMLLCDNCNVAMGLTGDDPALLRKLADYLEKHAEEGSA